MSAERRQFVDTTIVVYAYDDREPVKQVRAQALLAELGPSGRAAVSIQVLMELYVTLTRKLLPPLGAEDAGIAVQCLAGFPTHSPTSADVTSAIELSIASRISFWDAMLLRSASQLRCDVLWTEDLTPGTTIAGVDIRTPF